MAIEERMLNRIESDDNFMEWLLNPEEKLQQFNDIKEHMREEYLNDPYDIVISYSSGKDSTLVATLIWQMLESLPPEQRHKKVHIVSSDTLVETNQLTTYLHANLEMMAQRGKDLGIEIHLIQPRLIERYFRHVIGLGVIPPAPGKGFQWCTSRLKLNSISRIMSQILKQQPVILPEPDCKHRLTVGLGVRLDESSKRRASVLRYSGEDVFGIHDYVPNARVWHPVKYVSTDDLWNYLKYRTTTLPWGMPIERLEALYGGANTKECPVVRSKSELNKSCGGNSRNGCWTCLMGGRNDKMLQELIDGGDTSVTYLAEWKAFLYDVTFDCRYKDPIKGLKDIEKKAIETLDEGFLGDETLWYANEFEQYTEEYKTYERAFKGNEKGEYDPGKFSFNMRRMLLEKLFYAQRMAGYSLISDEEVELILQEWANEGFYVSLEDLKPINHQYDGAVVLKRDWSINEKETTNPNPIFYVQLPMNMSATELAIYHKERQRLTGRSIFCYYDHTDLAHMKAVYNRATFIVCNESITTQEQANEYVHDWFYLAGTETIGTDGQPFMKMTKEAFYATLNHLMLDTLQNSIVSLDEEIKRLKEDSTTLKGLSNSEQDKLSKKWLLFQRWMRTKPQEQKKDEKIFSFEEGLNNKSKKLSNVAAEPIQTKNNGQLAFII